MMWEEGWCEPEWIAQTNNVRSPCALMLFFSTN